MFSTHARLVSPWMQSPQVQGPDSTTTLHLLYVSAVPSHPAFSHLLKQVSPGLSYERGCVCSSLILSLIWQPCVFLINPIFFPCFPYQSSCSLCRGADWLGGKSVFYLMRQRQMKLLRNLFSDSEVHRSVSHLIFNHCSPRA
jgi:hypothetical protein